VLFRSLVFSDVITQTGAASDRQTGNGGGAVFTFGSGYNLVWGPWLAGLQSEGSLNKTNILLRGLQQAATTQTTAINFPAGPAPQTSQVQTTSVASGNLENKWTASVMLRGGYLVQPDLLVYGLVGWSWGGFDFANRSIPFTLNGITYGAGLERDYRWLRAFVQYKGISYGGKTIDVSTPFAFVTTTSQALDTQTQTTNNGNSSARRFSADVHQVTAGVTIPLDLGRW